MSLLDILSQLSEIPGPSGSEGKVREAILCMIRERVDQAWVDSMGNLIALKRCGLPDARKIMITAHMDEVGLMIVKVDSSGFLRFRPVGGIDPRVLIGQKVLVGDKQVPGVIGMKPIHLAKSDETSRLPGHSDLSIDIGATSGSEAEKSVKVGDTATFATKFERVGRLVKGKAFDDRVGCSLLVTLLSHSLPFDLYAVFTVQEEVGLRGARVAAYRVAPQLSVTLEGTVCDDMPSDRSVGPTSRMGRGPVITLRDASVVCDPRLVSHLMKTAEREGIPCQVKKPQVGGTDAGSIHLSREGVPCCVVSTPCRYIHSPACMASPEDMDNVQKLLLAALPDMTPLD